MTWTKIYLYICKQIAISKTYKGSDICAKIHFCQLAIQTLLCKQSIAKKDTFFLHVVEQITYSKWLECKILHLILSKRIDFM